MIFTRWLALSLLCAGCEPAPTSVPCFPGTGFGVTSTSAIGIAGRPVTVTLVARPPERCALDGGPDHTGVTVAVRVQRPDGTDLAQTATLRLDGLVPAVDVRFTPEGPGEHHVTARFDPDRGLTELSVPVAEDHSARSGRPFGLGNTASCSRVEALHGDRALCLGALEVQLWEAGKLLAAMPGLNAVAAGGVLWVQDHGVVHRVPLTFSGFGPAASLHDVTGLNPFIPALLIPISEDTVLVGLEYEFIVVRFAGGAFTLERRSNGTNASGGTLYAFSGERWLAALVNQACSGSLDAGAPVQCASVPGRAPPATDAYGLWYISGNLLGLLSSSGSGAPSPRQVSFPTGFNFQVVEAGGFEGSPQVRLASQPDATYLLRPVGGDIRLEYWGASFEVMNASARRVYARRGSNGPWLMFDRP